MSDEKYFKEHVQPLLDNHKENINYVGHISQNQINEYLCNSAVSFFTSTWEEPYGLVLAESLACGTPVIAYNIGAAPEILTSKTGILVEPNNIEELAKAFKTASKLSRKDCRNRAENFCSVEKMVESYIHLYEQKIAEYKDEKEFVVA